MPEETFTRVQELVLEQCFTCGIGIAMTGDQRRQFQQDGMVITCVLGHRTVRRKSENTRLREELAQSRSDAKKLESMLDWEVKRRNEREGLLQVCEAEVTT